MNKRIKIMCLSVLSLSLLSGTQVEAWPSFKKSAGAVFAVGVAYALWQNKDRVRDSIQERKNKAQKWFEDRFGECKERMSNAKKSIVQTLSEKKDALQIWAEKKSNNSGLSNFFSWFQKNTDDDEQETNDFVERKIVSSSDGIDFDGTKELNIS